jgi:hypothetical protein
MGSKLDTSSAASGSSSAPAQPSTWPIAHAPSAATVASSKWGENYTVPDQGGPLPGSSTFGLDDGIFVTAAALVWINLNFWSCRL